MKRAILLVDHGSRRAASNAALSELGAAVAAASPGVIVEIAHMELAPPTIAEGLRACVEAGAREVRVVPYFLSPGRHVQEDVPRLVREAAREHPGVEVRIGPALGAHPRMVELLLDHAREATPLTDPKG